MTVKTRATYLTDMAAALADNTTGAITEAVLRQQITDLGDSAVFPGDGVLETVTINAQTGTAYTLALTDRGDTVTMTNAAANTVTVPANATAAFAVGSVISIMQLGAGTTSITGATGVTINGVAGGTGAIGTRYQGVSLLKIGTDTWVLSGDVGAVS